MQNYKLLEDSTGEIADDLEHDNVFLNTSMGTKKEIIDKLKFINIKNFFLQSSMSQTGRKYLQNHTDDGLLSKIKKP